MSSETRKNACNSSVSHPSVAVFRYSSGSRGLERSIEAVSGTDIPRLHLPPMVFSFRDCVNSPCQYDKQVQGSRYN